MAPSLLVRKPIMVRFHLKENGEPGPCNAEERACPRGSTDEHFSTPETAREAFEKKQNLSHVLSGQKYAPIGSREDLRGRFENAHEEWLSARSDHRDPSKTSARTEDRLDKAASHRNWYALQTGAPTTREFEQKEKLEAARSSISQVEEDFQKIKLRISDTSRPVDPRKVSLALSRTQVKLEVFIKDLRSSGGSKEELSGAENLVTEVQTLRLRSQSK